MKPLSELEKRLRERAAGFHASSQIAIELNRAADELQAWLREADTLASREFTDEEDEDIALDWIRRELLGTTQSQVKQEGEK